MSQSPDQWVEAHLGPIAESLSSIVFSTISVAGTDVPLIVIWTAVASLFFTVYLRFINIRALGLAIRHARGIFLIPMRGVRSVISKPSPRQCQARLA